MTHPVKFAGKYWDGNMPLHEFVDKLQIENAIVLKFKKENKQETLEKTAQEIIDEA